MRRVSSAMSAHLPARAALVPQQPAMQQMRPYGVHNLIISGISLYLCTIAWGSWFNNFANVRKYGLWRFRNQIDDNILVTDFKGARWAGCAFGVLFWMVLVSPRKYWRKNSCLEQHPGWKRIGPL